MKHIKSLLCAILAAVFILAPAALAAGTEHGGLAPGACSHQLEYQRTLTLYDKITDSTHRREVRDYYICIRCGNIIVNSAFRTETHNSLMRSAVCGGTIHTYVYRCDCGKYMKTITVPCPRPGNCPGLPLSMILLPK